VRKEDETMPLALLSSPLPSSPEPASISRVAGSGASDDDLLLRVGGGDPEAFDELYRRFARPVYGLALRRLGDRDGAEDVVQETFASVWRSARSYRRERGAGGPWLYAVARNAIVDRFRARGEPATLVPDAPSGDEGPDESAEAGWVSWRVHRALAELPEAERHVLELAYWSGLSQSEVAAFLNVPLGTVKTRSRSALARLAGLLEHEGLR